MKHWIWITPLALLVGCGTPEQKPAPGQNIMPQASSGQAQSSGEDSSDQADKPKGSQFTKADAPPAPLAKKPDPPKPGEWVGEIVPGTVKDERDPTEKDQAPPITPAMAEALGGYRFENSKPEECVLKVTGVTIVGRCIEDKDGITIAPITVAGKDIPSASNDPDLSVFASPIALVKEKGDLLMELDHGKVIRFKKGAAPKK